MTSPRLLQPQPAATAPPSQQPQPQPQPSASPPSTSSSALHHLDSRFSCNICLDAVIEPVVTQCGHLYCWPCLFRWLEPGMWPGERQSLGLPTTTYMPPPRVDETRRVCPVCKAPCSVPSLVPIYVRTTASEERQSATTRGEFAEEKDAAAGGSSSIEEDDVDPVGPGSPRTPPRRSSSSSPMRREEESTSPVVRPLDDVHDHTTEEDVAVTPSTAPFGLRQRRGRSTANASSTTATTDATTYRPSSSVENTAARAAITTPTVPARPAANSPTRSPTYSPLPSLRNHNHNTASTALVRTTTPQHHPPRVGGFLAQSFQQALTVAVQQQQQQHGGMNGPTPSSAFPSGIPPLHRREGHGSVVDDSTNRMGTSTSQSDVTDPDATEFLSRILLLLGSFVILCLLLF